MENTCFCPLINDSCKEDCCMLWTDEEKLPCLIWVISNALEKIAGKI